MKIQLDKPEYPKICFAHTGDVLEIEGTLFLVCQYDIGKKYNPLASNGLYSNENPLFLVDLENGMARTMPHLSTRARNVKNIAITTVNES